MTAPVIDQRPAEATSGAPAAFTMIGDLFTQDSASLSSNAFRLYVLLKSFVNRESGVAWPSHSTLVARSGLSLSTVKRAVKELCDAGWLSVTNRRQSAGRYRSSLYEPRDQPWVTGDPSPWVMGDLENQKISNHKILDPPSSLVPLKATNSTKSDKEPYVTREEPKTTMTEVDRDEVGATPTSRMNHQTPWITMIQPTTTPQRSSR